MATFELLGRTYKLSTAELNTAPRSVLSEAAKLQTGKSVIKLTNWPKPDKAIFKARAEQPELQIRRS